MKAPSRWDTLPSTSNRDAWNSKKKNYTQYDHNERVNLSSSTTKESITPRKNIHHSSSSIPSRSVNIHQGNFKDGTEPQRILRKNIKEGVRKHWSRNQNPISHGNSYNSSQIKISNNTKLYTQQRSPSVINNSKGTSSQLAKLQGIDNSKCRKKIELDSLFEKLFRCLQSFNGCCRTPYLPCNNFDYCVDSSSFLPSKMYGAGETRSRSSATATEKRGEEPRRSSIDRLKSPEKWKEISRCLVGLSRIIWRQDDSTNTIIFNDRAMVLELIHVLLTCLELRFLSNSNSLALELEMCEELEDDEKFMGEIRKLGLVYLLQYLTQEINNTKDSNGALKGRKPFTTFTSNGSGQSSTKDSRKLKRRVQDCFSILIRVLQHYSKHYLSSISSLLSSDSIVSCSKLKGVDMTSKYQTSEEVQVILSVQVNVEKSLQNMLNYFRKFIVIYGPELAAEENIGFAVRSVLLPLLEQLQAQPQQYVPINVNEMTDKFRKMKADHDSFSLAHKTVQTNVRAEKVMSVVVECVLSVLNWQKHAYAILAPLVVDIGARNGQEKHSSNPCRKTLLQCLEKMLVSGHTDYYTDERDREETIAKQGFFNSSILACTCLFNVMKNILSIENSSCTQSSCSGGSKHNLERLSHDCSSVAVRSNHRCMNGKNCGGCLGKTIKTNSHSELNLSLVLQWVVKSFSLEPYSMAVKEKYGNIKSNQTHTVCFEKTVCWHGLRLLKVLIQVYPQSVSQYYALLLQGNCVSSADINRSIQKRSLISIITPPEGGEDILGTEERILSIDVVKELLLILPLRLWKFPTCQTSRTPSSSSFPNDRVTHLRASSQQSLLKLIICTSTSLNTSCAEIEVMTHLCYLTKVIITVIPFDGYVDLVDPASLLLHILSQYFVDNIKKEYSKCQEKCDFLTTILLTLGDCMGGIEKPDGSLTPLPPPTRLWLQSPMSDNFVGQIINFTNESNLAHTRSLDNETLYFLVRMVRTMFWVVITKERANIFQKVIHQLVSSINSTWRLFGAKLLQAFTQGKKIPSQANYASLDDVSFLFASLIPNLYDLIHDKDSSIRCIALSTYGSLLHTEWEKLLFDDKNHFTIILSLCMEYSGEKNGLVRSEACKAVGNIMTECISGIHSPNKDSSCNDIEKNVRKIIPNAIKVSLSAVEDSNPGVRSMALFAIGNITHAILSGKMENEIKKVPFNRLCETTYKKLDDVNDKVVGNAIRTIGHLFHLFCHSESFIEMREEDSTQLICMYGAIIRKLANKIELALNDVLNTTRVLQRSWKKRSHAKKHAWGACTSLMPFLSSIIAKENINHQDVKIVIHQLICCIQRGYLLNEKISLGALSTLQKIPQNMWPDGMIGLCLAVCLRQTYKNSLELDFIIKRNSFALIHKNVQVLLKRLLYFACDNDIFTCLKHDYISQAIVDFLYNWMVDQEIRFSCFACVGAVLCSSDLDFDIFLMQKFNSQTKRLATNTNVDLLYFDEPSELVSDDEEDEL